MVNRQIGETQVKLLAEAAGKVSGQIMVDSATCNREWCAMKRMVRRGLFLRLSFGPDSIYGRTVVYEITDAGREKLRQTLSGS